MKNTFLACLIGVSITTGTLATLVRPSVAEVCPQSSDLCKAPDVVDTLEENGPSEEKVKIFFANVGGRNLAFAVSNNTEQEFYGVTVATSHYSEELTANNMDDPIVSFRLHYNSDISNVTGETQELESFLSLVGKAFSYGATSIEVSPEDFADALL